MPKNEFSFISNSDHSDAMLRQIRRFGQTLVKLSNGYVRTEIVKLTITDVEYVIVIKSFDGRIASIDLYGRPSK